MKLPTHIALAALLLAASPSVSNAQMESREGIALQNQILELRAQIQQLQQSQGGTPPPPMAPPTGDQMQYGVAPGASPGSSDVTAQLVVRVGSLEEQVRELQGKVEDLTNQLQRQSDQFSKQLGDLQFKLGQGSTPGTGAGAGAPAMGGDEPAAPGVQEFPEPAPHHTQAERPAAPPPAPPRRTPENALREGNAALARRDYAAAAAAAREVIASHGVRSTDAQFLLARAEAGQHQYREAAADYYLAYNHAPRSSTAPVALLGVANALIDMKDSGDACQALQKLTAEFPSTSGNVRSAVSSARKRAGCR